MHPSEPLTGMCGCGTLFCRRCSPSAVFCAHCHQQHQDAAQRARAGHAAVAHVHPGLHALHHHAHPRPLSQRVMLEALLMTILSVLALAAMFGVQNGSLASGLANIGAGTKTAVAYGIDPGSEPVQKQTQLFKKTLTVPDGTATLTSDDSYSISAKVESAKGYSDSISSLIPYDLLLAWGDMSGSDVDSRLSWEQGDRRGEVSGALGAGGVDLTTNYVISHVSNNHLIPSTDRIARELQNIKAGDLVRIDGRLVDVRMILGDDRILTVNTSKSRTDQGDGACEIIYVEHLRVNNQSY